MALKFDAVYYFLNRPDVLAAYVNGSYGISAAEFAEQHFRESGWREGSNPNAVFNVTEYLTRYPDIATAGVDPFLHYQQSGQAEGRAPNATFPSLAEFDFQAYLDANPDLGAAGIDTAAEAYDHYINSGYLENRPGAPNAEEFQLTKAFADLEAAQEAVSDYLEGARENAALREFQGVTDTSDAATVSGAINSEYVTTTNALQFATGLSGFASRSETLQNEAIRDTREIFQDDIDTLNTGIASVNGLAAAIAAYNNADAAQAEAAIAADAAEDDSLASLAALNSRTGGTFDFEDGVGGSVNLAGAADVTDIIEVVDGATVVIEFDVGTSRFILTPTTTEAGFPGVTLLLNDLNANLAAQASLEAADIAEGNATTTLGTYDAAVVAAGIGPSAAAVASQADLLADQLESFNELVARFENADDLVDSLEGLNDAVTEANDAFAELGYSTPEVVDAVETVTADGDLFVFNGASGTISAGFDSSDALFIGSGYTVTTVADDANLDGNTDFGNVSALDIFIQQDGANTVVYIENETYDGQANGTWAGETITLVGIDAENVSIRGGVLLVSDPVVA